MSIKNRKILMMLGVITMLLMLAPLAVLAGKTEAVSLGADLTAAQRTQMLEEFGVSERDVDIIEVSIQDVEEHLKGIATKEKIGTKAISSSHVKLLPRGEGLGVSTHNITWVTKEMYANALVTAGVKDAEVQIAAPFDVTGTTALTGIMLAFEEATGEKLSTDAKETANEELFVTEDISQDIGKDEAVKLIQNVKKEITQQNIKTPEDMRQVILNIAQELGINLSEEQVNQILNLMEKISKLDLNVDTITKQLDSISRNLDIVKDTLNENKGFFQNLLDSIMSWLRSIFG
ncbi:DUF1002 domain-containing protein [Dehalobacterium formicoaceticum]|uniref:DUF1002 domain-containing protein n=1 Tax=Dehalobacterium formicoaceticum TaxID=51515 RepID=A0ABT1Y3W9_9FIRM|nr:DUF1002 domain-containing protein [Dehalobacterium formicoaceticum]MCR6545563.1 DUF1002 domain-containing protein [Dehalobacterium formicoaceticum]